MPLLGLIRFNRKVCALRDRCEFISSFYLVNELDVRFFYKKSNYESRILWPAMRVPRLIEFLGVKRPAARGGSDSF